MEKVQHFSLSRERSNRSISASVVPSLPQLGGEEGEQLGRQSDDVLVPKTLIPKVFEQRLREDPDASGIYGTTARLGVGGGVGHMAHALARAVPAPASARGGDFLGNSTAVDLAKSVQGDEVVAAPRRPLRVDPRARRSA